MNFLNMSFHNGTTRFVVTIPWLGIALKFAHIHPIRALKTITWVTKLCMKKGKTSEIRKMLHHEDEVMHSVRWQFRGIYCNIRESRFYKESRNPFLWPTLFSVFGLVNIQPFALIQPPETEDNRLWCFMLRITNGKVWKDGHTFSEEGNYAIDTDNHLRLLDYGSTRSQQVIHEYGHELYTQSRQLFS